MILNSVINDSFAGEDLHKKDRDSSFVGENTEVPINSYFAGDSSDQKARKRDRCPFCRGYILKLRKTVLLLAKTFGNRQMARLSVIAMVDRRANQYPA